MIRVILSKSMENVFIFDILITIEEKIMSIPFSPSPLNMSFSYCRELHYQQ